MATTKKYLDETGLARLLTKLRANIMHTASDCSASTNPKDVAGASAVKELNSNLTANDGTSFNFQKSDNEYGFLDENGNFQPFGAKADIYLLNTTISGNASEKDKLTIDTSNYEAMIITHVSWQFSSYSYYPTFHSQDTTKMYTTTDVTFTNPYQGVTFIKDKWQENQVIDIKDFTSMSFSGIRADGYPYAGDGRGSFTIRIYFYRKTPEIFLPIA